MLDECKLISNIFKCLSHPIRLKIIKLLEEKSLSVLELAENLNASQSSISQHLKILEENGIVIKEKQGNVVHCKLKHKLVLELLSDGKRIISQELNEASYLIGKNNSL
jgi:ArsR family transcriptional regulator